jgi:hypothetical protein
MDNVSSESNDRAFSVAAGRNVYIENKGLFTSPLRRENFSQIVLFALVIVLVVMLVKTNADIDNLSHDLSFTSSVLMDKADPETAALVKGYYFNRSSKGAKGISD